MMYGNENDILVIFIAPFRKKEINPIDKKVSRLGKGEKRATAGHPTNPKFKLILCRERPMCRSENAGGETPPPTNLKFTFIKM